MATTTIYKSYGDFLRRDNKEENGVSETFAQLRPDFEKQNETNDACWNCSDCACCSDCSRCSRCSECSDYLGLKNASPLGQEPATEKPLYPVIENIHQKVLEAASGKNALNMGEWHTCDTTHCRAGWVTHLAGEEGKKLELETSTLFAAMMIYNASSPIKVSPPRFFESIEQALADMERCAKLEKENV